MSERRLLKSGKGNVLVDRLSCIGLDRIRWYEGRCTKRSETKIDHNCLSDLDCSISREIKDRIQHILFSTAEEKGLAILHRDQTSTDGHRELISRLKIAF